MYLMELKVAAKLEGEIPSHWITRTFINYFYITYIFVCITLADGLVAMDLDHILFLLDCQTINSSPTSYVLF